MASEAAGQNTVRLKVPVKQEDLAGLKIGTVVLVCLIVIGLWIKLDTLDQLDSLEQVEKKETELKSTLELKPTGKTGLRNIDQKIGHFGLVW